MLVKFAQYHWNFQFFISVFKFLEENTMHNCIIAGLGQVRWLNTVFQGQYLLSFVVNYIAINKDLEELTPQLY